MIEVAKLIADPPPDGLVEYLEHFRDFIGSSRPDHHRDMFGRMVWATDYLINNLPLFQHLPLGDCPKEVAVALEVLPRVRKMLAPAAEPPGRKRPVNVFKKTAAAVVVTACYRCSGPIGRAALHEICQAYWEACSGAEGDAEDWWRHVNRAMNNEHLWTEQILTAYVSR